jgi:acyl-ACP thioesterase
VLLRYAQDLAWYHAAQRGFDRAWYAGRGLNWLVRAAEVAVLAPMPVGDELIGTTWAVGRRRVWARRRTEFSRADGTVVGWTHIDWLLLDARGSPTRIPAQFDAAFGTPLTTIGLARVALGEAPSDAKTLLLRVRPQEVDPMAHANNAVYVDWLDEAVISAGDEAAVRRLPRLARLEYARAAEPGADLTATAWPSDGGWAYRLADAAGADLLRARLEADPN